MVFRLVVVLFLSMVAAAGVHADPRRLVDAKPVWELVDVDGVKHAPFARDSTKAIVLIFISTDCPIANSYQPLLGRLAKQYENQGVKFFMIHPNTAATVEEVRQHVRDYRIATPVVIDRDLSIASRVKAKVTPEAFVIVRNQSTPAYRGRIDDLYAGYGKKRNKATTHELADALQAVVAGRKVKVPETRPLGCYISYPHEEKSLPSRK